MKYLVSIVLAVLLTGAAFWFFANGGNPFEKGRPAARSDTDGQQSELNQKISDLAARVESMAFDNEKEFGRLNGKISEMESQGETSESEDEQETKSLDQQVLELKTQLDSAKFHVSQLEEQVENYHALSLSIQEKLAENQSKLEAMQEQLANIRQQAAPEEHHDAAAGAKNEAKVNNEEE